MHPMSTPAARALQNSIRGRMEPSVVQPAWAEANLVTMKPPIDVQPILFHAICGPKDTALIS